MFGFPKSLEEFELKHYIRLCVIICGYLVIRPGIEYIFKTLGEKDRQKALKKEQEEAARRHKEHRVKEKLGIPTDQPLPADAATSADTTATEEKQKASVAQMLRRKPKSEREKLTKIYNEMLSDEDVGDLISRVDSSKEE